jgi:predicted DNA binding protein
MKHVRVRMTAHGREAAVHPMYDLMANAPFVERATAMQWNVTDGVLGILHYVEGDPDRFDAAVAEVDQVIDYEIEPVTSDAFYAYVWDELTELSRALFGAISGTGVVVVPPIRYCRDGTVLISTFGPADAIQETIDGVEAPVELTVERVGGLVGVPSMAGPRLSDRQRAAVEAALELGYYEVPRAASQADVARELDCAPSTAAEHLRKAEATLARSLVDPA